MNAEDLEPFTQLLDATCTLLSRERYVPDATHAAMWFNALREHDLSTVRGAFSAHIRHPDRGRFVPTPADIIARIEEAARDGRPDANEAWAIALASVDEGRTVVWNDEIALAFSTARTVLELGDKVGARMAFLEAYNALLERSRGLPAPPWRVSLGTDRAQRAIALDAAAKLGRLVHTAPPEQLAIEGAKASEGTMGELIRQAPPEIRERLMALRDRIAANPLTAVDVVGVDPGLEQTRELQELSAEQVRRYEAKRGVEL